MKVFVLNGWAATPRAWDACRFRRDAVFSYVDVLDGTAERAVAEADGQVVLVGWSMGGAGALQIALRMPEKTAGLVLAAATPRMMRYEADGWSGMTERRLEALRLGLRVTVEGGAMPGVYSLDDEEALERGLRFLRETDLRGELGRRAGTFAFPVEIVQSERDAVVRRENADFLSGVFPRATVTILPGGDHAVPVSAPGAIDDAVGRVIAESTSASP